ncbi:ABC transporter ATP-binding protein [Roseibium limicola]|uniref:ABC transporter ATP-binding protein n=1 Tax=Roseibium limicola TaxID=2816037 RepID=UPI002F3EE1CC
MSNLLEAKNVTAAYGKHVVLDRVSVRFAPARLTALVGPNGCGKSTLLKSIMGFLPQSSGEIAIGGEDRSRLGRRALARRIAYLPQESHCPDYMTLGELVELAGYSRFTLAGGPSETDRKLFHSALETVGLADQAGRRMSTLSGGQRQRAWIAMVLAQDAEVILMDEPVNHLDVKYQYSILKLVRGLTRSFRKTVIVVLHDLNLAASFSDDVVMLKQGRVVASGPVRTTINSAHVEEVFDLSADIFERNGRLVFLPHQSLESLDQDARRA